MDMEDIRFAASNTVPGAMPLTGSTYFVAENNALRTRIIKLEEELAAATHRIKKLESAIEAASSIISNVI